MNHTDKGAGSERVGRRRFRVPWRRPGWRAASAMNSPIGSARLNGLATEAYRHYVIERIADHPVNRIDELLPRNVAPLMPASARVNPIR